MSEHRLIFGDVLDGLRMLDAESVDMCATSPPYWGLRDYGHEGQIGLEETPEAYVARLVEVFAEVRRVLKPAGTCWVNLGDSYANTGVTCGGADMPGKSGAYARSGARLNPPKTIPSGLKPKDLCGIPWRVAFALQADGWWLRNAIVWAKKNPMPNSVVDRFSSTYEHVFLLTKQARYWFDLDAVREAHREDWKPVTWQERKAAGATGGCLQEGSNQQQGTGISHDLAHPLGKNPGDVWRISTKPTPYAHFATWPPDLVERMIVAGCPPKVCAECGSPYAHIIETAEGTPAEDYTGQALHDYAAGRAQDPSESKRRILAAMARQKTGERYEAACACNAPALPGTVLDPFCGSGTTTQVARKLGRRSIGIELNPEYEAVMRERLDLPTEGSLFSDEDLGVEFVSATEAAEVGC